MGQRTTRHHRGTRRRTRWWSASGPSGNRLHGRRRQDVALRRKREHRVPLGCERLQEPRSELLVVLAVRRLSVGALLAVTSGQPECVATLAGGNAAKRSGKERQRGVRWGAGAPRGRGLDKPATGYYGLRGVGVGVDVALLAFDEEREALPLHWAEPTQRMLRSLECFGDGGELVAGQGVERRLVPRGDVFHALLVRPDGRLADLLGPAVLRWNLHRLGVGQR